MLIFLKKTIDYLSAKPVRFFLAAALLWMTIMCVLNTLNGIQWNDILVEANGMAFDLLVFGVLLSLYEALRDKKDKIERLYEELDDYKEWDEMEARFRILGVFYRLKKLGESKVDLNYCFLEGANFNNEDLKYMNFSHSSLRWATFESTNLYAANFQNSLLVGSNLHYANLNYANLSSSQAQNAKLDFAQLESAILEFTNFYQANLFAANLKYTNLETADFTEAILSDAQLEGARVGKGWFEKLEKWKVIGREGIIKKYKIDTQGVLELIQ